MRTLLASLLFIALLHGASPEERAVAYLAREVARWPKENGCFSCHNNGDAARALYVALKRGPSFPLPLDALAGTTRWLLDPTKWDENRGNPAFSDKKLARIQFAAALAQAVRSGAAPERALVKAAESLLPLQERDGSWRIDTGELPGSPVTWGTALATHMARYTLLKTGEKRFAPSAAQAFDWFRRQNPRSVVDASATLMAMPEGRKDCRDLLLDAQNSDGGWGPYRHAPTEAFDTAIALLALRATNFITKPSGRVQEALARGRKYLIRSQQPEGGWQETTRPAGYQSYAHHISTSGWATLALLSTPP